MGLILTSALGVQKPSPTSVSTPPDDASGSPEDGAEEEIMDRLVKSVTQSTPMRPGAGKERKRSRVNRKSCKYLPCTPPILYIRKLRHDQAPSTVERSQKRCGFLCAIRLSKFCIKKSWVLCSVYARHFIHRDPVCQILEASSWPSRQY